MDPADARIPPPTSALLGAAPGAPPARLGPRVGRPRRGTESARTAALISAATRVFLRDGYAMASMDKVAGEAGVSTRTIYDRYRNKADLLVAVITRLIDADAAEVLKTAELDALEPREALHIIARTITARVGDAESIALFRIVAAEALRFPELAAKMRSAAKRMDDAIANFLRGQIRRGTLKLSDPERAAALFMQMICGELHDCLLFGDGPALAKLDLTSHIALVIDIFLCGALPRSAVSLPGLDR